MVGRLEDVGKSLRDGKRKDEQVAVPHVQGVVEMSERGALCVEPLGDGSGVLHVLGQPEFLPLLLDNRAHPHVGPVTVLEVRVEIKKCTSRLLDVSVREVECTRALHQTGQDGEEMPLDVFISGSMRASLHRCIERVLEHAVNGSQVIQSPQGQDGERLYVSLDLELGNTVIVGRFGNNVPSDRLEVVHHVSAASRHTTALNRPSTCVHGDDVENVIAVLHLAGLSPGVDSSITALAKGAQITVLVSDCRP